MIPDTDASDEVSTDLVFEILSNKRRRMVLYYLRQSGEPATVRELAEQIAALENDVDVDDLANQQRKRVYVSLYQTHIPKLQETGIIEYDEDAGEVRLTDRAMEIDTYLTPVTESEYPWQAHYFILAVIGGVLFALSLVGVPAIADIPVVGLGVLFMASFGISAIVQYWYHNRRQKEVPAELMRYDR
jgi:DNA-binding transcriptional ArsR family regulator